MLPVDVPMMHELRPLRSTFEATTHRWLFDMVRQSLVAEGHLSPVDSDQMVPKISRQLQVHWWSFMPVKHMLIEDGRLDENADDAQVRAAIDEWLSYAVALATSRPKAGR